MRFMCLFYCVLCPTCYLKQTCKYNDDDNDDDDDDDCDDIVSFL